MVHVANGVATFLFLLSLSLQSDIPLPGLGEGVKRREKEGDGVRSRNSVAGEGVGVGELMGECHPEKATGASRDVGLCALGKPCGDLHLPVVKEGRGDAAVLAEQECD